MRISSLFVRSALSGAALILVGQAALAIDLNGLWSSDASACDRIFEKKGNSVAFRQDSDMYGSGFIVDGQQITREVDHAPGFAARPMTRGDVERKFRGNAGERWRKEQADTNLRALWAIDQTTDLGGLLGNFAVA